ncbi:hypothetical protein EDC96DRAFT_445714, partial [Choanephora cucurbitarum]
ADLIRGKPLGRFGEAPRSNKASMMLSRSSRVLLGSSRNKRAGIFLSFSETVCINRSNRVSKSISKKANLMPSSNAC